MTKAEARALCDKLKAKGCRAVVPRGTTQVRLTWNGEQHVFNSIEDYKAFARAENQKITDFIRRHEEEHGPLRPKPRSPIEAMIDKACGLE